MAVLIPLIVMASVVLVSSSQDLCSVRCPCVDPLTRTVLLPGPSKNQFYMCNYGKGILFNCGPGTHFNPKIQVCDWPSSANAQVCNGPPNCKGDAVEGSGSDED